MTEDFRFIFLDFRKINLKVNVHSDRRQYSFMVPVFVIVCEIEGGARNGLQNHCSPLVDALLNSA